MTPKHTEAQSKARVWLEFAAKQYPDGVIPAELGGAWLTEISMESGCPQTVVEQLARSMGIWTASIVDIHTATRPAPRPSEPKWLEGDADA